MKSEYRAPALSILAGLFIWVIDAAFDYFYFYEGTFWELFITQIPAHRIYFRSTILSIFVITGVIHYIILVKRQPAEEKIRHFNSVLRAIHNVEQLISKEKDSCRLLKKACINLTATRGYGFAWIATIDNKGKFETAVESGLGKNFKFLTNLFRAGKVSHCWKATMKNPGLHIIRYPSLECAGCPRLGICKNRSVLSCRLEHKGRIYGLLAVSISSDLIGNKEEQTLFEGITNDLALALHDIEQGKMRQVAERALLESEQRFRIISETTNDMIHLYDYKGRIIFANHATERLLGYQISDIRNSLITELIHPDCRSIVEEDFFSLLSMEKITDCHEIRILKKDGSYLDAEYNGFTLGFREGEKYIGAVIRDITGRKKSEEALRKSEERFRAIFNSAKDSIFIKNEKSEFITVNDSMVRLFKRPLSQFIGRTGGDIFGPEAENGIYEVDSRVLKGEIVEEENIRIINGDELTFHVIKSPMRNTGGDIIGLCGIARDITEMRQLQRSSRGVRN